MSDHQPKQFSTGEFARLCGTTKDTLFHYDRLGILKPPLARPTRPSWPTSRPRA